MKRIIEVENEDGFESMLGESIVLWCGVYIYTGILSGVHGNHLELTDAYVVYETGPLLDATWKDAQPLPGTWRVMIQAIESWGQGK